MAVLFCLFLMASAQETAEIEQLIANLGDFSPEVREKAERALLAAGATARDALAKAAKESPDEEIRLRAGRLVKWIAKKDVVSEELAAAIPECVDILLSDDPARKSALLTALTHVGPPMAFEKPVPALAHTRHRYAADDVSRVLADIAKEMTSLPLKRHVLRIATTMRVAGIAPALVRLLEPGEDPVVLREAMGLVAAWRETSAIPALKKLSAETGDEGMRNRAILARGQLGDREVEGDLARLIASDDPETQGHAAIGLALLGTKDHIPAVRALLKSENGQVLMMTMDALRVLGDRASMVEIAKIAERESARERRTSDTQSPFTMPEMRIHTALGVIADLGRLSDEAPDGETLDILRRLAKVKQQDFNTTGPEAAATLAALGYDDAVPVLLEQKMMMMANVGAMNRLASPERYRELGRKSVPLPPLPADAGIRQFIDALGKASGVKIVIQSEDYQAPLSGGMTFGAMPFPPQATFIDLLDFCQFAGFSYVIGKEQITVAPAPLVQRHFRRWWLDRKAPKEQKEF